LSASVSSPGASAVDREIETRFGPILGRDEPLDRHTTLGVGGRARFFLTPRDPDECADVLGRLTRLGVPSFLIGGGANLVIKDAGFDGAVVNLSHLSSLRTAGARVRAEAGVPLARVARRAMEWSLGGLEGLVGIPGTLGGSVYMNAGGRHGELGDVVESVLVVDRRGGRPHRLARDQVGFRYRGTALGDLVVLDAVLVLAPAERIEICKRMAAVLKRKHQTQPMGKRSAGCVFKNPAPERAAARLIDEAGLKGERVGAAEVSPKHANFIVNEGGASAADFFELVAHVRRRVLLAHGTPLALEVKVLGERGLEG